MALGVGAARHGLDLGRVCSTCIIKYWWLDSYSARTTPGTREL